MKNKEISWNMLSIYRNQLCGIAIIWIMLFHLVELKTTKLPSVITDAYGFLVHGNIGVEVFLILSGLGLYYSYSKIEDGDILLFYKRRIKKIFISYIIISGTFFFIQDVIIKSNVVGFFKDISTLSFWSDGNRAVWFIALIIPMYLIYPFVHRYILKSERPLLRIILAICLIYILLIILKEYNLKEYVRIEIALTRIPAFLIGCYIGKISYDNIVVSTVQRVGILLLVVIGLYAFGHKNFSLLTWKAFRVYYFLLGIPVIWMFIIGLDFLNSYTLNKLLFKAGGSL